MHYTEARFRLELRDADLPDSPAALVQLFCQWKEELSRRLSIFWSRLVCDHGFRASVHHLPSSEVDSFLFHDPSSSQLSIPIDCIGISIAHAQTALEVVETVFEYECEHGWSYE